MKSIWIITICYNSGEETKSCINSLLKLNKKDFNVFLLVIDNGSKIPLKLNYKDVEIVRSEKNLGFTGGNNLGISYAISKGADYILLINNDTIADPDLLTELYSVYLTDKNIGITCPKIYFQKGCEYHKERYSEKELGHVLWFAGGGIDWKNAISYHRGMDQVDIGQYNKNEYITFSTGCCMFFSRAVANKVGLFDNQYFLYVEDADLSVRLIKSGFSILYVPNAKLWHINAASSGSGSFLHDYFLTRNKLLFGMKYAPFRTKIALLREGIKLFFYGRKWQKIGIIDYFTKKLGQGSWQK